MNPTNATSAYFENETDARRAAEDLRANGCDVDVRSESSHGQTFWESIKHFFSGEQNTDRYRTGAVLSVTGSDPQTVRAVIQQYNGRIRESAGTPDVSDTPEVTGRSGMTGPTSGLGTTGAGLGAAGIAAATSGGIPPSTTGEIGARGSTAAIDDLERARTTGRAPIEDAGDEDRGTI